MRNLKCVHHSRYSFEGDLPCTASTWDTLTDSIIYSLGPTKDHPVLELSRSASDEVSQDLQSSSSLIASWDALSPLPDLNVDCIVDLQHLPASETVCVVLAGGDIVVVRLDPLPDQDKIEIVGSVDAGITAAAWSTDQDVLVIATRGNTLLYMTADFENSASATFSSEDARLSKQVSVGWGKAETQFKGKRAKALRDPTVPEKVDEGTISPHDKKEVTLSWRGDGAYVAVNAVEADQRRMIRVYSRDGVLDSVTEPVDGLTGALSWKPSGETIASVQQLEDQTRVVFFERNGLRHGEYDLRLQDDVSQAPLRQISLAWNIDSTALAVCFQDRIQLWTMGNYHYYLKQDIALGYVASGDQALPLRWHTEEPLRFSILEYRNITVEQDGAQQRPTWANAIRSLQYVTTLASGPNMPPDDVGNTLVIDGRFLRITPLRLANVPPPMALHELTLEMNVVDAAVNSTNTCIAVLHADAVAIFDSLEKDVPAPEPSFRVSQQLPPATDMVPSQICFCGEQEIYILFHNLKASSAGIFALHTKSWIHAMGASKMCRITPSVDYSNLLTSSDSAASMLSVGQSATVGPEDGTTTRPICTFPTAPVQVEVCSAKDSPIAFGLSSGGILYANERLLMRNCTSFLLTQNHLIVTTTNHFLKFIHMADLDNLDVPPDHPEQDERCRNIERGAKLVAVMPTAYAVVLQMPRGNLETIYPRALVLAGIRRDIEANNYRKAFLACRSQRVDMNILHDHDPQRFLGQVEIIVGQLRKVEYIDLFLSQLSEADVSKTLYKDTVPAIEADTDAVQLPKATDAAQPASTEPLQTTGILKVNGTCDAFLAVLEGRLSTNLQNVITANLCKSPPDIEAGLSVILGLDSTDEDTVERAVEHICFLADVNRIYEAALGMYELSLALLIAQQSQKDPREYLPYLQKLQEIEGARQRFQIDDDLAKYSKALAHLHAIASTEEFLAYTEQHELYQEALKLVRYEEKQHKVVLNAYADFLSSRNRFRESAIAYESLGLYLEASEAYRACNAWRESLSSATLATPAVDQTYLTNLATSLADSHEESKDYYAAATIRLDYLDDIEGAARTFCKGYHFAEAIRLVGRKGRKDLAEDVIDPGLGEGFATLSELLAECKGQLGAQVPRLRELRTIKAQDPLAFLEGLAPGTTGPETDIPDNISLAPSNTSTSASTVLTRYTHRTTTTHTINTTTSRKTSKNRRREERKRARGKKGSVYEEEYLVNSVGRLIERVNDVGEEVGRCVEALCRRGMWERARSLEGVMGEVVGLCAACVPEVWEVEKGAGGEGAAGIAANEIGEADAPEHRPLGGEGVLWDSLDEARRGRTPPVVKPHTGMALLGS